MYGFLLFLTTVDLVPHAFFALPLVVALAQRDIFKGRRCTFLLLMGIGSLAMAAYILGCMFSHAGLEFGLPRLFVYPLNIVMASRMRRQDKAVFIRLVALECIIGLLEFAIGKSALFGAGVDRLADPDGLLYFRVVQGLSTNSSDLAQKVLLSVLMMATLDGEYKFLDYTIMALFAGGLVVTFNRTSMLTILLFMFLKGLGKLRNRQIVSWIIVGAGVVALVMGVFHTVFWTQFNKGHTEGVDLSGRELIWIQALAHICEHPWFGSFGRTIRFEYFEGYYHSHNSFLQLVVENGFLLAGLLLLTILTRVNKRNVIYVIPLVFYSLTQYGLFWGLSIMDIGLWHFLLFAFKGAIDTEGRSAVAAEPAKV